jgi:hypothetical protein
MRETSYFRDFSDENLKIIDKLASRYRKSNDLVQFGLSRRGNPQVEGKLIGDQFPGSLLPLTAPIEVRKIR